MIANTPHQISTAADDADPFVCPMETLQMLLDVAVTEFEMGYLSAIHQFRMQLSILTGRDC